MTQLGRVKTQLGHGLTQVNLSSTHPSREVTQLSHGRTRVRKWLLCPASARQIRMFLASAHDFGCPSSA